MSYVKFTKTFNKQPVYIHYRHVVSITEYNHSTAISTTAVNAEGNGQRWTVIETVDEVLEALDKIEQLNR